MSQCIMARYLSVLTQQSRKTFHLAAAEASGYLWWAEPRVICLHFRLYCFCSLKRTQRFGRGKEVLWLKSDNAEILKSTLALPPFFAGGLRLLQPPHPHPIPGAPTEAGFFYFIFWLSFGSSPSPLGLAPLLLTLYVHLGAAPSSPLWL